MPLQGCGSPRLRAVRRAAAAAVLAAFSAACGTSPSEPAAELVPLDGEGFRDLVQASRGRPLVVNFWATWCEPCREELPALQALHTARREEVRVVAVSVDSPGKAERVRRFLGERGFSFPQYIRSDTDDEAFIAAVDPEWSGAVPATFLYDGEGARARRLVGQQTLESIEAALQPLLTPPTP
jgi:thiol-disulfide isomerase/thioredoxin